MVCAFHFPKPSERLGPERSGAPRTSLVKAEDACKKVSLALFPDFPIFPTNGDTQEDEGAWNSTQ